MAKSYASRLIPASAKEVWAAIRDFDGLPQWHPGISSSTLAENAHGTEVGAVRILVLADGAEVREQLVALDDAERTLTYDILSGPFPVRSYRATLRAFPISGSDQCLVEWFAHYDADAVDEADLDKTFAEGVFGAGLHGLNKKFETRNSTDT
ncbi:SRPBCC family protein [Parasphingorhabdus pacifica]